MIRLANYMVFLIGIICLVWTIPALRIQQDPPVMMMTMESWVLGVTQHLCRDGSRRFSPEPPQPRSTEEPQSNQPGNHHTENPALKHLQALESVDSITGSQEQTPIDNSDTHQDSMSDNGFDDDGGV